MRTARPEHLDVLIVGAGLSGIGAGCQLQNRCPERSYAILEARTEIGGTWDLFRFPGVRSDSDMQTLGYAFRPWADDRTIADGQSILDYIRDTAAAHGVLDKIRSSHRAVAATWSSARSCWTVEVDRTDTGETVALTCDFLLICSGYYDYERGYTPEFAGTDRFPGPIVHPQHWPEDLDYTGRRVVVIGSGATAITLVPAMAQTAAHVTMLQRSPSYVVSLPAVDALAKLARRRLAPMAAYQAVRWKNVALMNLSYRVSRRWPRLARGVIRKAVQRQLPDGFDVDTHFKPRYDPWDQRLCVCPDGDLFKALHNGSASIVTDQIESFTERGLALRSGQELEADVIVTATGLRLQALGAIRLVVDGREVKLPETMAYKGMMLSGVPNLALALGYTNASWTLKADLTFEYVCRLLNHMRRHGYRACVAVDEDPRVVREPLIDLAAGYVLRSIAQFPSQGSKRPWRVTQNYARDVLDFRLGRVDDGVMRFSRGGSAAAVAPVVATPATPAAVTPAA